MAGGLELGGVYCATIERVKAQGGDKSRLGMTALMWASHSERPLPGDGLGHALSLELDCRFPYWQHSFNIDIGELLSRAYSG